MSDKPSESAVEAARKLVDEFTDWARKNEKMGYTRLWQQHLTDLIAAHTEAALGEAARRPWFTWRQRAIKAETALAEKKAEIASLRADWEAYLSTPHDVVATLRAILAERTEERDRLQRSNENLRQAVLDEQRLVQEISEQHGRVVSANNALKADLARLRAQP